MLNVKKALTKILTGLPKTEQRTLLWTNPSPNSTFTAQDVTMPNGTYNNYDFIEVVSLSSSTYDNPTTGTIIMDKTPCKASSVSFSVAYNNDWWLRHRARWWDGTQTKIHFDTAYYNSLTNPSSTGANDANCVPYKIYGIKLGS